MQYGAHNFQMNFTNAKSLHPEMAKEMLVHEIAEMVINHQQGVVDALRDSGIKVSDFPTRKELVNLITEHGADNEQLRENIAALMIEKNTGEPQSNYSGCGPGQTQDSMGFCHKSVSHTSAFDGGIRPGKYDRNWNSADGTKAPAADPTDDKSGLFSSLASNLGDLFGSWRKGHEKKKQQQNAKTDIQNTVDDKAAQQGAPAEGLSSGAWIGIGVGAVAFFSLLGFIIYKARKK